MTRSLVVLALSTIFSVVATAQQSIPRKPTHGRLFPPEDLGLLDAPDRDIWQRPDQIMDALAIAEASVVADVGAGGGWFTVRLARRVGPNGIVYSQDVQREMLESLGTVTEIASVEAVEVPAKSAGDAFVASAEYKAIVQKAKEEGFPRFSTPTISSHGTS